MPRHPWLPHPPTNPPPPTPCPSGGPHFRTAALALAAIPDGVPSRDIPARCPLCEGGFRLTDPTSETGPDMTDQTSRPAEELAVLAPLATLIEKTIRDTPIRMGPGGTDNLTADLTVKTCVWVGKNVLPRTKSLAAFVNDVDAERQRQLAKFGEQHHPDGTGDRRWRDAANVVRGEVDDAARRGLTTWRDILREEVFEAFAESDPAALRAELVQVAAVCAAWIADLDQRPAPAAVVGGVSGTNQ